MWTLRDAADWGMRDGAGTMTLLQAAGALSLHLNPVSQNTRLRNAAFNR